MADEDEKEGGSQEECKCEECPPAGAPAWMATFSDLVTLLLTFFVLLLSFAKTETAKYEAALGSIRNAFGGNVLKQGEVIQRGKSPDDSPSMIESQDPVRPFPIEFLTMEGLLDKHEINRESTEDLKKMRQDLGEMQMSEEVTIYEMPEGIKVRVNDKVFFKKGTVEIKKISVEIFEKTIKLLTNRNWTIFVEGHAGKGERSIDGKADAFTLSSLRAAEVTKSLIRRGVRPDKITTVFYGDTRPNTGYGDGTDTPDWMDQRVEFIIRKSDLRKEGHKVDPYY